MKPRRPMVFFAMVALLYLAWPAAAVSSSEALAAIGPCIQQGNPQLQPFGQTFNVQSVPYFVFYYPTSSPQRLVAAVSQDDGSLVRDNGTLQSIAAGIYDDSVLHDFIKTKGYSADLMLAAVTSSQSVMDDQYTKVQVFQTNTNDRYPNISFQKLETSLDALRSSADALNLQLSDTSASEQQYLHAPSAEDGAALIRQYNASFTLLFNFLGAYDNYKNAISDVENQLYVQSVPDPDNKNINTNLENLRDIGINSLYAKAEASDPRKTLTNYLSQSNQWAQDSVSSFEFQDLSCRANAAYDAASPQFATISRSSAALSAAGLSTELNNVKTDWAQIQVEHDKRSADSYQALLNDLPKVTQEMNQLTTDYQTVTRPTSAPSKPPAQSDPSSWIILVLVLLLGAYGFWMYRKKQQAETEGGMDSDEPH